MVNINITEKSIEIKGTLKKGNVKPFGTSGHIPFSKEHIGKIVDVIIPDESRYVWVFNESLRNKLSKIAKEKVQNYKKDKHYFLNYIDEFMEMEFSLDSLIKVISVLEDEKTLKNELTLIKKTYQI